MAKIIQVSDDAGANYHVLPGGSGEKSSESAQIDDTVFGQTYQSNESGLIELGVNANALYKGFAGYQAIIQEGGTPTAAASEAMTLVSGKTFRIDDATKEIWDRSVAIVVYDNAIDETAEVLSVDYLFGQVTFKAAHTVTEPVTVDITYLPVAVLGKGNALTLTQTAETKDTTDFTIAQANGGYMTVDPGLRSVQIEMEGIYLAASGLEDNLTNRDELIITINPDGNNLSRARGFFRAVNHGQSGDVGALEDETVTFALNVPIPNIANPFTIDFPFKWDHDPTTTLSLAIQKVIEAWEGEIKIDVQYLSDGINGSEINAVVTDVSMTTGLSDMNEFTCDFVSDGAAIAVP